MERRRTCCWRALSRHDTCCTIRAWKSSSAEGDSADAVLARHLPLGGGIRRHLAFIVTPPLDDDVVIAGNIDDASKDLT